MPAMPLTRRTSLAAAVALALTAPPLTAGAEEVTVGPFSRVSVFSTNIINDRIGNSRFFAGPNDDLIRVSTFVYPSPDSDFFPVRSPADDLLYQSTNGASTRASVTHPDTPDLLPFSSGFVGLRSGRGGGFGEYTFAFRRSSLTPAQLLAWDTTPVSLTASNPTVTVGPSTITYAAPDFDPAAVPNFARDVRLTGGGLQPRLDWTEPEGTLPTDRVTIQVRRIDAESADRSRITRATLVHSQTLAAGTTGYAFTDLFSNAGLAGFPSGLELGRRYEIALVADRVDGDRVLGRARTFFELAPLAGGTDEVAVFLPSVGPDGRFKFDVAVQLGESVAIDPEIAVGYDYAIGEGDPLFRSVKLPDLGDGQYGLSLWDGSAYSFQTGLAAGTEYFFAGTGVSRFRIDGIETSVGLNPSDPTAFVTTLTFAGTGRFTGTMTPLTVTVAAVPEPASLALWAAGLLFVGRRLRRRA